MLLRDEYPMLGLISEAFPYRRPCAQFGEYASIVLVAPCNMACPYCDVGGYKKDRFNNLPGHRSISLKDIEEFVDAEVETGNLIYFSGGEPMMFPELIDHLARRVRRAGGYSVVCTNASYLNHMVRVSPWVDEFSISLKGRSSSSETVSGVRGRLAFDLPYRNALQLRELPNRLEFVIVLFDDLDLDSVVEIYEPFVGRAFLVFKEFRPKLTTVHDDHSYESIPLDWDRGVLPMPRERMLGLLEAFSARFPEHGDSFNLVMGGGGNQHVRTADQEFVFSR